MVRKSVAVFATVLTLAISASAHAQFGLYGTVTVDRISGLKNSPLVTGTSSPTVYNNTVDPLGGTGGIFYDFRNFGPVRLGLDLRGSVLTTRRGAEASSEGAGAKLDSGLAGIRAVFHTPILALRPYVQGSAGIGRTNYGINLPTPASSGMVNNFEYHVFAGADLKLLPVMDFRVVELGYGGLDPFGSSSHNYPLKSVSTGLVFHFPVQ